MCFEKLKVMLNLKQTCETLHHAPHLIAVKVMNFFSKIKKIDI